MSPSMGDDKVAQMDDFVSDFLQWGGRSYCEVPRLAAFDPTRFSLAMWLRPTGVNDDGQHVIAYGQGEMRAFSISGVTSNLTFNVGLVSVPTNVSLACGQWHFVAVTFSLPEENEPAHTSVKVYVGSPAIDATQAVRKASTLFNQTINVPAGLPLSVGCAVPKDPSSEGYRHFQGAIKSLAIWSKELQQDSIRKIDEVGDVMRQGIAVDGAGMPIDGDVILNWSMDTEQLDMATGTICDASGRANSGVVRRETQSPCTIAARATMNCFETSELTVETWLRCGIESADSTLLNYSEDPDASQLARLWIQGMEHLTVWLGGESKTFDSVKLNDGRWHHVALVFSEVDGQLQVQLLKDFERVSTQFLSLDTWKRMTSGQVFCLGSRFQVDSQDTLYHGLLRNFRIWEKALAPADLKANAFHLNSSAGLVASYDLDAASVADGKVTDGSGRGNDLRMDSAKWLDADWVDLSGNERDLTGFDFRKAYLRRANLSGAQIRGHDFTGADLNRADLSGIAAGGFDGVVLDGARINGTRFAGSDLTPLSIGLTAAARPDLSLRNRTYRTSFENATVPYALVGTDWTYLDLTSARIPDLPVVIKNLRADHAVLRKSDMLRGHTAEDASFDGADFTDAVLSSLVDGSAPLYTTLTGCSFKNADLSRVQAYQVDFQPLQLSNKSSKSSTFVQALFHGSLCTGCNFKGADLSGAFLDSTPVSNAAKFTASYMPYAKLPGARLRNADFTGVHLYGSADSDGATLAGADLTGTDFTGAILTGLSFTGATLEGTVFNDAQLIKCDFSGAALKDVKFDAARLQGATFSGARVQGCVFVGAWFGSVDGTQADKVTITEPNKETYTVDWKALDIPSIKFPSDCTCPDGMPGPCTSKARFKPADGKAAYPAVPTCIPDDRHPCDKPPIFK